MLWKNIEDALKRTDLTLPVPYGDIFAVAIPNTDSSWLIGPYASLTTLATSLRTDKALWDTLTSLGVRLGLRSTDVPSMEERQVRYGPTRAGFPSSVSFASKRVTELAKPARPDEPVALNRRTDREKNVLSFWQTQTPQSHHIVEYNNLRDIDASATDGKGQRDMDYNQLPAVLLAAEFHQRYISVILKKLHGMDKAKLVAAMPGAYRSLYIDRSHLFDPLWRVTKIVFDEAGLAAA